ncbi:GntR family transcriptional regulator [Phreatobacter sp. HK31-P]
MTLKSGLVRVEKKSAEHQAVDNLRRFILSGGAAPGARLTEAALAGQLGVSRATTRTGMHRLAAEGILVQVPYTGWQVASITAEDAWELWTLRGSLEGLAARLVSQHPDDEGRQAIAAAMADLRTAAESGDTDAVNDRDFAFHRAIVERARHARLLNQYVQVENQVRMVIAISNQLLGDDLLAIVAQHAPMAEALLAGDPERAQREAWTHNESEGRKLVAYLAGTAAS